jgi:hypothetical protein
MKRPQEVDRILLNTPGKLMDRAYQYDNNLQILHSYILLLETELLEKEQILKTEGDALKNLKALRDIRNIVIDTLGFQGPTG